MNEARVVGTLEQLYEDRTGSVQEWGATALAAMQPVLDEGIGVGVVMFDTRPWKFVLMELLGITSGVDVSRYLSTIGPEAIDRAAYTQYFCTARPVTIQSDIPGPPLPEQAGMLAMIGAGDMLGLVTEPEPGVGLVFCAALRQSRVVLPAERSKLTRLALHLEASMRARLRPDSILGTLSPSGRFELGDDPLERADRDEITRHMGTLERVRLRANRGDGAHALDMWTALTAGRVSLLERVESDGKRLYAVCENAPRHRHLRALSPLETNVISEAARGLRNKEIAYALGISEVRTSQALGTAVDKLGLPSTAAALRLAAGLRGANGSLAGLDTLTAAERAVAELAATGLTNRQIATQRGSSERTVANQIASILQKTGASSRRAFVVVDPVTP